MFNRIMGYQPNVLKPHPAAINPIRLDSKDFAYLASNDNLRFSGESSDLKNPELSCKAFEKLVEQKVITSKTKRSRIKTIAELSEILDLFLQGEWSSNTNNAGKEEITLKALKNLLGKPGQGNIVLAQINPTAGDILGNSRKIMAYIDRAEKIGIDTIVFPELSLIGYPIRDWIGRCPTLVDDNLRCLKEIAKRTQNTRAIVGFVEPRDKAPTNKKPQGRQFFNSLAILGNGKIEGIVRKSLLPNYSEFNDWRQFEPSPVAGTHAASTLRSTAWGFDGNFSTPSVSNINQHKYGFVICEDSWNKKDFFKRPLYTRDPVKELVDTNPGMEVLVSINASPSRARKEQLKQNKDSNIAKTYNIPYVMVNQVGAIDEHSFDGASRVYDGKGKLVARAKSFREQFLIVNPLKGEGAIYPLPAGLEKTFKVKKVFKPYDKNDMARMYESLLQGIRDYFKKTGHKRAVLGLSGGLDSTITAVLLADALGSKNVWGFSMPNTKITSGKSKSDAQKLAENLGINFSEIPIDTVVQATQNGLEKVFKEADKKWGSAYTDPATYDNIQARARAMYLWAVSNQYPATMPIATSDKSELYLGYATINGDMSGGFAPIADVTKSQLFALGRWMNKNRPTKNDIPRSVLAKPPGAELKINPKTKKPYTAEEVNGPYAFLEEAYWRQRNLGQSFKEMMKESFEYEKKHPVASKDKKRWLESCFGKIFGPSPFKWTLMPSSIIIDDGGIGKTEFQPVITARIPWKGFSNKDINIILDEAQKKVSS